MATRSLQVQGGPPLPVASWLNRTAQAKQHSTKAVSNPLPLGYETGIIPLDRGGTTPSTKLLSPLIQNFFLHPTP